MDEAHHGEAHHDGNALMAPTYSVGQLLVLDDPALIQHITDNRDARAMFDVTNIRDWDDVPESQQTKLLERLMYRRSPQIVVVRH